MVGASPGFNSVCHMVRRVASTQATVLFLGESGVGKEVFARTLHRISPRAAQPFVALNCAAIPEALVESELFGVEKGAYTGALASRMGRFERASGGTLFLDEIGILSMSAQGKLLRALQDGEIERLGDDRSRKVDVRVVAATNLDLREEVSAGRFREDLFYRLNVFPILIPPLRERREDIPILMNHFLERYMQRHGRRVPGFTGRAIDAMLSYRWPGNIRELENMVERGVILATEGVAIDLGHLFTSGEKFAARFDLGRNGELTAAERLQHSAAQGVDPDLGQITERLCSLLLGQLGTSDAHDAPCQVSLDDIETALLKKAVGHAHGNLAAAARILGITRPQLVYRLKTRGIVYDGECRHDRPAANYSSIDDMHRFAHRSEPRCLAAPALDPSAAPGRPGRPVHAARGLRLAAAQCGATAARAGGVDPGPARHPRLGRPAQPDPGTRSGAVLPAGVGRQTSRASADGTVLYAHLALSGGGANGAFGAGFLNGWTATGQRPTFKIVTGVSTGALMAPFAFLGPDHDDALRQFYTTTSTRDIFTLGSLALAAAGRRGAGRHAAAAGADRPATSMPNCCAAWPRRTSAGGGCTSAPPTSTCRASSSGTWG